MSATTDQIDAVVAALWGGVVAQQDTYHAQGGLYYQLLWTHGEPPSQPTPPDSLDDRPTDQPASTIQGLPATMRSRMRIDTYGQPAGWTMTLQARIDGELWQRSIDCGVDESRSQPWTRIAPPS